MTLVSLISSINLINLGVLFFWVFLSSFGIPGGLVAMISSGALANSFTDLFYLMIVAIVAAILGDIIAYELARRFSIALGKQLNKFKFFINNELKATQYLAKYEFFAVFLTRFLLTGLGAITSYISGFEKLNRKKYILAVVSGEILYGVIYTTAGYIFKLAWNDFVNIINDFIILTILVAITIVLLMIIRRFRKKHNKSIQVYSI